MFIKLLFWGLQKWDTTFTLNLDIQEGYQHHSQWLINKSKNKRRIISFYLSKNCLKISSSCVIIFAQFELYSI